VKGWLLARMMSKRKIRSAAALARGLNARGVKISRSQIHRLQVGEFVSIDLALLHALCRELRCSPNDLICVEPDEASPIGDGGRKTTNGSDPRTTAPLCINGVGRARRLLAGKPRDGLTVLPYSGRIGTRFGR
jgi:DNA-binding Xre family transcriptional regulator